MVFKYCFTKCLPSQFWLSRLSRNSGWPSPDFCLFKQKWKTFVAFKFLSRFLNEISSETFCVCGGAPDLMRKQNIYDQICSKVFFQASRNFENISANPKSFLQLIVVVEWCLSAFVFKKMASNWRFLHGFSTEFWVERISGVKEQGYPQ